MTWFKVDDGLAFHSKTLEAGNAAMGLWVRAGSACAREGTDGFVSVRVARQLGTAGEARRLVAARLWLEVEGGYQFHEWEQANPTRAEVEDRRAKRAEAGRLGGLKAGRAKPTPEASAEASATAGADYTSQPPARPGPTQTPLLTLAGRLTSGDARASQPAEQIRLWQDLAGPGADLEAEARAYLERYLDRPARDERGAWLGWLRRAAARAAPPVPQPRPACGDPACHGGWLTTDPDQPVPCRTCRPHLRATREEAS